MTKINKLLKIAKRAKMQKRRTIAKLGKIDQN
jgi:hypothetical protein